MSSYKKIIGWFFKKKDYGIQELFINPTKFMFNRWKSTCSTEVSQETINRKRLKLHWITQEQAHDRRNWNAYDRFNYKNK
jgi:hypothetical protein